MDEIRRTKFAECLKTVCTNIYCRKELFLDESGKYQLECHVCANIALCMEHGTHSGTAGWSILREALRIGRKLTVCVDQCLDDEVVLK